MYLLIKRNERFVNPLTKSFRRPPGSHLGRQLGGQQMDLAFSLAELLLYSLLPVLLYLVFTSMGESEPSYFELLACGVALLGVVFYCLRNLTKQMSSIRKTRLGYECELAVGQELDQLMKHGYDVFHDVQAEGFNIDHVVVSPGGVFAVETKGRSKKADSRGKGKTEYRVSYENGVLKFPSWSETKPIKQAELQSQWLSQWLAKATGSEVSTTPVIILPGWFVNNKGQQPVTVLAEGQIASYFTSHEMGKLSAQHIKQVVYQLDQRVRDIRPGEMLRPS